MKSNRSRTFRITRIYLFDFIKLCFGEYPNIEIMESKNKPQNQNKRSLFIFGSVFIFLVIIFITLLTRHYNKEGVNEGTLGDVFNGVTAPFIALLSAALIFYSFQEQVKANNAQLEANKLLQSQWQFDTFYKMYNEIDHKFSSLTLIERVNRAGDDIKERTYKANGWLVFMYTSLKDWDDEAREGSLNDMAFIMNDISTYINFVEESEIPQKDFFLERIHSYYTHNIEENLIELYWCVEKSVYHKHFKATYLRMKTKTDMLKTKFQNTEKSQE